MVRFATMLAVLTLAATGGTGVGAPKPIGKCCGKAQAAEKKPSCCAKCGCCQAAADGEKAPAEGKEVKLTGTLVCAKCKLKLEGAMKCTNALQVKEGEKTVTYLLDDKGMKEEYHECGGGQKEGVTVVGKLTEKDGKKWVKPSKVEAK